MLGLNIISLSHIYSYFIWSEVKVQAALLCTEGHLSQRICIVKCLIFTLPGIDQIDHHY